MKLKLDVLAKIDKKLFALYMFWLIVDWMLERVDELYFIREGEYRAIIDAAQRLKLVLANHIPHELRGAFAIELTGTVREATDGERQDFIARFG
jgi:hypothetical protein